jgi:hypothetical protein
MVVTGVIHLVSAGPENQATWQSLLQTLQPADTLVLLDAAGRAWRQGYTLPPMPGIRICALHAAQAGSADSAVEVIDADACLDLLLAAGHQLCWS